MAAHGEIRISEIFYSLQGESTLSGLPTVFVRLTGCPLRCGYCDTAYAFTGGEWHTIEGILQRVKNFGAHYVCVTGGEPLAQKSCFDLLQALCDAGYGVSIETSGAMDICDVDTRVVRVMDIKTPGSGEFSKNLFSNIDCLTSHDEVKFVICDRNDYDWSCDVLKQYKLADRCKVLFSPSYQTLPATDLAEWILRDKLPVRMQIQLHKFLWGEKQGV
ncbi:MAG: 7-carboxy-7-deazaguanine synthase QueE [Gammaproteobacteria bacterium]|nr:7-carboxy-7-deazaguanine synthase QueE [Gammaproteobacteria bacterium]